MRSVRLDDELEARLEQAAEASGQAASDIIRQGVRQRCDEILARSPRNDLAEFIGSVASGRSRAAVRRRAATSSTRTGQAFARLLDVARSTDNAGGKREARARRARK